MSEMQQASSQLRRALSDERLEAYRRNSADTDVDLLANYLHNIALVESFYPLLHCIEITLRNQIDAEVAGQYGQWLQVRSPVLLREEEQRVADSIQQFRARNLPVTPGRLIAELEFSFWTSLFRSAYDRILWPRPLLDAFPHAPRAERTRWNLSRRLTYIRRFRNRVFHHEPIWKANLQDVHSEMLVLLAWMNRQAVGIAVATDRFDEVYRRDLADYESAAKAIISATA
jgi:hypothetical protein